MPEPNQYKQTPGRALLAFAIVACLIAVFTVVDSKRRGSQEGIDLPTALGDKEWFEFVRNDPAEPVVTFGERPLFRQEGAPVNRFDMFMFKTGREDSDRWFVYRYWNYKRDEKGPEGEYFLKLEDGLFMKLGVAPKSESDDGDVPSSEPLE